MGLSKEELIDLNNQLKTANEKAKSLQSSLEAEQEKITKLKKKVRDNCEHIIIVTGVEEDPDEEDDDTIYHTCIVCGATTRDCKIWFPGCNDNYTGSLYGYDTRIFTTVQKARTVYDKVLKEEPGISTEDMVKRLVSHFIGPSAAKKLKLIKEKTNHGEW